jgi:hypothetical protein
VIWFHLHLRGGKIEMRNYRNAVAALVLALVFSTSAFAGIIHTDKTPPPPTTNGEIHTDATGGEIPNGEAVSTPEATDTIMEAALNLLQSLLTLF